MDVRLKHAFTCTEAGPTSSGKTWFVFRLIKHVESMITFPPEKIVYCYGEFQLMFAENPTVEFQEGLPSVDQFDDLINEAYQNVCNLFTKLSHHRNVSVVFIMQNLFHKNKFVRPMNLNTNYIVMFKNPRDASQVAILARQMYYGKSQFVVEAYEDATKDPHGYLLIDLRPDTDDTYRIRTKIIPDDPRQYAYLPKV
jgi:hypothetical protein